MTVSRTLIWLLILATVLIDGAVWSLFVADDRIRATSWPHPVLFALTFSQVSLVAVWAALGTSRLPWRLAGTVLVIASWSATLATLSDGQFGYNSTQWVSLLGGQALVLFAPLSVARAGGVRLLETTTSNPSQEGSSGLGKWQFSLASVMAWITATAVVLGFTQYTVDPQFLPLAPHVWISAAVLIASHSAMAVAVLWAVLGTGRPIGRTAALCLTVAAVLALYGLLPESLAHARVLTVLCLVQAALLIGSLCVGRVAGYRLKRNAEP